MKDARMLYRYPGPHEIDGEKYDYIILPENQVPSMLTRGWYLTTAEAKAAAEPKQPPVISAQFSGKRPPSELTPEEIEQIRNAEGIQKEIAEQFNVTVWTVSRIKTGRIS